MYRLITKGSVDQNIYNLSEVGRAGGRGASSSLALLRGAGAMCLLMGAPPFRGAQRKLKLDAAVLDGITIKKDGKGGKGEERQQMG